MGKYEDQGRVFCNRKFHRGEEYQGEKFRMMINYPVVFF